jgi:hypothetical protein
LVGNPAPPAPTGRRAHDDGRITMKGAPGLSAALKKVVVQKQALEGQNKELQARLRRAGEKNNVRPEGASPDMLQLLATHMLQLPATHMLQYSNVRHRATSYRAVHRSRRNEGDVES